MFKANALAQLEKENRESTMKLEQLVKKGEDYLSKIQQALADIAKAQLAARKLQVS